MKKLVIFKSIIKKYQKVVIAFSGGVDSALLLKIAIEILGKENVIAVTAVSETYSKEELRIAKNIAQSFNSSHILLETYEFENNEFINNTPDRCYYCKQEFYRKVVKFAKEQNYTIILEGSHCDDLLDYRPGRRAVEELGIKSPYIEAGIGKKEIREIAKAYDIKIWDKPANPCLASRIPYGVKIGRASCRERV